MPPITPTSTELDALKLNYDIMNVHPIMQLVFRSSGEFVNGLSNESISLDTLGTGKKEDWKIMSYRKMALSDSTSKVYSAYCYPKGADQRLTLTNQSRLSSLAAGAGLTLQQPSYGSYKTSEFSWLAQGNSDDTTITGISNLWTLAYALTQHRLQRWRDLSTKANPDFWGEQVKELPVFLITGTQLLSTTLGTIFNKGSKTDVDASSNKAAYLLADRQFIHQSNLNNYMLAAGEKSRNSAMMSVALFDKSIQARSPHALQLFQTFRFSASDTDPDFKSSLFTLYKSVYDLKRQPMPWTHYFGALQEPSKRK